MTDIVTSPIKFLGATVLSFNTSLGLGSAQESTLNVDLVEDCDAGDRFLPAFNEIEVGAPVYFSTTVDGTGFNFGGVLTNWTITQGGSGRTFNVKVADPRQLLQNAVVIIDSYNGPPTRNKNYFNVYAQLEGSGCDNFGASGSTEKGTPYNSIINALKNMKDVLIDSENNEILVPPILYSPTCYRFHINFDSFPPGAPEYYRLPGPSVTVLQLVQDICNVLGLEFYCYLTPGFLPDGSTIGIINIGTIDLKIPPTSFANIVTQFDGIATDLSYGEELRNEVTKSVIFGEKQHYLSPVYQFNFYFGEEWNGNDFIPIIPYAFEKCYGFWIKKRIRELNITLKRPLNSDGPFTISEQDIRAAMASFDVWFLRAFNPDIKGTLNKAVRDNFEEIGNVGPPQVFANVMDDPAVPQDRKFEALVGAMMGPNKQKLIADVIREDIERVHKFVADLGNTYYGKQWFTRLNESICYYQGENFQEKIFNSIPTNAGGWVDPGVPVLGLNDPDLGTFKQTDERISCFVVFAVNDDDVPKKDKEEEVGKDEYGKDNYGSNNSGPDNYGPEGPNPG